MDFTQQDYNKLKKIGIHSLLDLCLCVPKSYTNTFMIPHLVNNATGALEVMTKSQLIAGNTLRIAAHIPNFHRDITLIIFNHKPFHRKIFQPNKKMLIHGKLQIQLGQLSLIQPKCVSTSNTILLHFKFPSIRDSTLQDILSRHLTHDALLASPLPPSLIPHLLEIFHPSPSFLHYFETHGNFPPKTLEALKFIEIYRHIHTLSTKRRHFPAKISCKNPYQDFVTSLPFSLTNSQTSAIATIAKDLSGERAARRIIMGDVGCGKTIVILASVVMAYPHQCLLMVPTTILAFQIYEEAKKLLPAYIQIRCIAGKEGRKEKQGGKEGGNAHFIIGTQALLYREFDVQNLALVMTDEQHRFGTNQRHHLEKMAQEGDSKTLKKPHFLQFSATPIPRTLSMLHAHLIDFSFMRDLPYKKDITTRIITKTDFNQLLSHIKDEVAKSHQCAIVYPLVEESEHLEYLSLTEGAPFWKRHFEGVFLTSGGDKEKEEVLSKFRDEGSILLATTLIEVGISLPRLSTIVIIAPERIGLATLHQLRGRVSRNGLKGYCFLYTNTPKNKRLEDFCNHLSGFDIAEIDLKYRSGGDLFSGEKQSGERFRFFDFGTDARILALAEQRLAR